MTIAFRIGCVAAIMLTAAATLAQAPVPAPDFRPDKLWDGRKMVPFRSIDMPKAVPAEAADFLDDADYVLGVTVNGESRAYPTRFIWWHHAVNDRIGGEAVGVTYCSVCNTGIAYDLTVDGKQVALDFYGLYNGVVALCDRDSGSVFLQGEGRYATGSLAGTQLKTIPLLDTTWGRWRSLHPDTLVMSPDTPQSKFYSPRGKPEPRGYDRFPAPFFQPSVTRGDLRLPPFEKVLGVKVADGRIVQRRAYSLAELLKHRCVVNDRIGKTEVAILLDPDTMSAVAASRTLDGRKLTFTILKDPDGKIAFIDRQTQTRWTIEGRAIDGPLAGKQLKHVDCHLSQWYGWAASYPDTSVFGLRGKPRPGDPWSPHPQPLSPSARSSLGRGEPRYESSLADIR